MPDCIPPCGFAPLALPPILPCGFAAGCVVLCDGTCATQIAAVNANNPATFKTPAIALAFHSQLATHYTHYCFPLFHSSIILTKSPNR